MTVQTAVSIFTAYPCTLCTGLNLLQNFDSLLVCAQPDIPHIDEHVSKVECIGVKTQQKLLDIKGAAVAVGIADLNVVHNSITTGECHTYCSFCHHSQSP